MKDFVLTGVVVVALAALLLPVVLREAKEHGLVGEAAAEPLPVSMLFVGDIMLDRSVARHARVAGPARLFAEVEDVFLRHDVVVGNLEGTLTTNPSVAEASSTVLRFTANPMFAEVLREAGVTTLSLANNHTLDFGEFGLDDTRHHLGQAGLAMFGTPYNEAPLATATTVKDKTLCFVGYHELYRRDPSTVVAKIEEIEPTCNFTTLVAHWGEEYEHEPSVSQRELAHLFVDAGTDLVIGAHPHVVQPLEIYNNVAIFYSLGNFVFDQGWRAEVRRGVMVSVEFVGNDEHFTLIPVNTYLEATLADEAVSAAVLTDLNLDSPTFVLEK